MRRFRSRRELYGPKSSCATHLFRPKAGKSMSHPTPSDFIVNVTSTKNTL
jgi:hypothetical protein